MPILTYALMYAYRLIARRVVHKIIDGDDRPIVGRGGLKTKRISNQIVFEQPLSHARQFLGKNKYPKDRANLDPTHPLTISNHAANDLSHDEAVLLKAYRDGKLSASTALRGYAGVLAKRVSTTIVLPLALGASIAGQLDGNFFIGTTAGANVFESITRSLGHPLPINDTRNFSRTY